MTLCGFVSFLDGLSFSFSVFVHRPGLQHLLRQTVLSGLLLSNQKKKTVEGMSIILPEMDISPWTWNIYLLAALRAQIRLMQAHMKKLFNQTKEIGANCSARDREELVSENFMYLFLCNSERFIKLFLSGGFNVIWGFCFWWIRVYWNRF